MRKNFNSLRIKTWSISHLGHLSYLFVAILLLSPFFSPVFAGPQSTTYELKQFGFGSGGTEQNDSTSYSLFGVAGEQDNSDIQSTTYGLKGGLTFTLQAAVPAIPTLTNTGTNYDRLKIVIDSGGNPTDTTFAVAISTDNFVSDTRYIQDDFTIGSTLGNEDWLPYNSGSPNWNGTTGQYITSLIPNTTYYVKVKARQGNFTESPWSETANAATSVPTLSFGIDSGAITFDNLSSSNSYTDSSKSTTVTTSTNAYNGYIIYGRELAALTYLSNTIANYTSSNSSPTTWSSGVGFGYTTNDTDLTGGTSNRFVGSKYAGFTTSAPGDPVADHAGPVTSAISGEQFIISYKVAADASTIAGKYTTTVLYIVVPTY